MWDQFIELADTTRQEIGIGAASHDLTITANVHIIGETDYRTIDKVFSQSLTGTLSSTNLTWDSELTKSKSGSISEMATTPINYNWLAWGTRVALILIALFGLYVMCLYVLVRPLPLSALEAEVIRVKKKSKDVIVYIVQLQEAPVMERVISVSSLDDLIKTTDAFLKPVFHKAEPEKYISCVIDDLVRYDYVFMASSLEGENLAFEV